MNHQPAAAQLSRTLLESCADGPSAGRYAGLTAPVNPSRFQLNALVPMSNGR